MRLASVVFVVACGSPATSLQGTVTCSDMVGTDITCPMGQLCIAGRGEPDDGSIPPRCATPVEGCLIRDCMGADCPRCVLQLCYSFPDYTAATRLEGRTLYCP